MSECPRSKIIFDHERGEYICIETGEVIEDHVIDWGPEWRVFSPEDRVSRSRVGGPLTSIVHDQGLTTTIGDARGRSFSEYQKRKARKLQIIQRKLRVRPKDRKLVNILSELNAVSGRMRLPPIVRETAANILRKLLAKYTIRRPQITGYIAAAIYIACKINKKAYKTVDEILRFLDVDRKEFWLAYKKIRDLVYRRPLTPSKPIEFVERITYNLSLPPYISVIASRLAAEMQRRGLTDGKGPLGVAAASVYVAAVVLNHKKTQREIAERSGVTEVTVRNRYKDIVDNFLIVVDL